MRWLAAILLIGQLQSAAWAENHALLIGVGAYPQVTPLEGPRHDIAALRDALIAQWGFAEKNIVTLVDGDATRERILRETGRLKERSQPGDTVFLYFSGHGTSSHDPNTRLPMEADSGALVPVDASIQGTPEQIVQRLVVGRRDLRPLLSDLDQANRRVFVAFDACYSGNTVRSLYRSLLSPRPLPARYVVLGGAIRTRAIKDEVANDIGAFGSNTRQKDAYPYRNVFYLSAASEFEQARDIGEQDLGRYSTVDNRPHGALTDALLRALTGQLAADTNHDGRLSFGELYRSVADFMAQRQYGHTPQALPAITQDSSGLAEQPVFPRANPSAPPPPAASAKPTGLRVQLAADMADLRRLVSQVPGVTVVEERPDLLLKRDGNAVLLITGAGDLLGRLEGVGNEPVVQRVRQQVRVKTWLEAGNPAQRFNLSLALNRSAAAGTTGGTVNTSLGGVALEGDRISFTVRSEQPAYLLLLDVDPAGGVHVLYPYDASELKPLPAGQVVEIPGGQPEDWVRVEPPFGTEYVLAYAFSTLRDELKLVMGQNLAADSPLLERLERLLTTPSPERAQASLQLITAPRTAVQ